MEPQGKLREVRLTLDHIVFFLGTLLTDSSVTDILVASVVESRAMGEGRGKNKANSNLPPLRLQNWISICGVGMKSLIGSRHQKASGKLAQRAERDNVQLRGTSSLKLHYNTVL